MKKKITIPLFSFFLCLFGLKIIRRRDEGLEREKKNN